MNISQFSSEQMIDFCFSSSVDLEERITTLNNEFIKYSLKVKNGEPFSQHTHDSFLMKIEVLTQCKDRQFKFIHSFLNDRK